MFQNVLVTALTPLCNTTELQRWENRPFSATWPDEDRDIFRGVPNDLKTKIRAKKRSRTQFRTDQLLTLEEAFMKTRFIDKQQRYQLSSKLNIDEKCIKIWFQNRRMKDKKEKESSDLSDNCSTSDSSSQDHYRNQYYINNYQNQFSEQQLSHSVVYRTSPVFYQPADSTSQTPNDYIAVKNLEDYQNIAKVETVNEVSSSFSEQNIKEEVVIPKTEYYQATEHAFVTNNDYQQEINASNDVVDTQFEYPSFFPSSDPYSITYESCSLNEHCESLLPNDLVYNDFMSDTHVYPTEYYSSSQNYFFANTVDHFNDGYN